MMVLCAPGSDRSPMTSVLSYCPSCYLRHPELVLLGLYECREDTNEDMPLVRMGLPGAADDLARTVYAKVKSLHLSLPSLADECPRVGVVRGEMKTRTY
jgi:hypothetical protein